MTQWLLVGRSRVRNSGRGNHLGQRSCASATTGRTYSAKRSDQTLAENSCGEAAVPPLPCRSGRASAAAPAACDPAPGSGSFVDRQHHRVSRRTDVEADDIGHFLGEALIARALEAAHPMRLELMGVPMRRTERQRDGCNFRHRPAGPVRCLGRRFTAGQRHHTRHRLGGDRRLAGLARLVPQQSIRALLRRSVVASATPSGDSPQLPRHLLRRLAAH